MAGPKRLVNEVKWLILAAMLFLGMCALMLFSQPNATLEPVDIMKGHRPKVMAKGHNHMSTVPQLKIGELNHMTSLLSSRVFTDQGDKLKWIGERMSRLGPTWEHAQKLVAMERSYLFTRPLKILLFPGLLSEYSMYDFAGNAYKGGYLGELVQWSDLISTLHMLGHQLNILTSKKQLSKRVSLTNMEYDLIFTDYIGLFALRDSRHFPMYKCRLRILDSFGTEPIYQFRTKTFEVDESMGMFNNWNFENPRQFWTLFPHTPDNSFLGFVVESKHSNSMFTKRKQGVIYGKEAWYRYGRENFLDTIAQIIELHSTFKDPGTDFPGHIINHGVLTPKDLQTLLEESSVFVGLGFPYDGPGPFEALASGCVFIQPKFSPPHSYNNTGFFKGKPTSRELSSQVPYLEHYVGKPYVYTLDVENLTAVREAVYEIITQQNHQPFIPHEFSQQGMLERIGEYLTHQNFCDGVDLALGKPTLASSAYEDHTPSEAVDGKLDEDSCFWSAPDDSHWWSVDLGGDMNIVMIRITNTFEWILAKSWGVVFLDPFIVTLIDSHRNQVASRKFSDSRTFYLWTDIHVRASTVRIDSLERDGPRYFVLCAVQVFGDSSQHPVWPDLTLLHMLRSKRGVSCKEACRSESMVCEPAYFKTINSAKVMKSMFNCSSVVWMEERYVDFTPACSLAADSTLGVDTGTCVLNNELLLLSCSGHHDNYIRLCPCRQYTKGQMAIPPRHV